MEYSLLKNGIVAQSAWLSQRYTMGMANAASSLRDPITGNSRGVMSRLAVASAAWVGPKLDADYAEGYDWVPAVESARQGEVTIADRNTASFHLRNYVMVPAVWDEDGTFHPESIDMVKKAVYEYGVLATSLGVEQKKMKDGTFGFYNPNGVENHVAAIAGWDDNYPATSFIDQPPGNGAWLIRNSWGDGTPYHEAGYLWMSYYDKTLHGDYDYFDLGALTSAENAGDFDFNYQYQTDMSQSVDGNKMANVFTVPSGAPAQELGGAMIPINIAGLQYRVKAYVGGTSGPESGVVQPIGIGGATYVSGSKEFPGIYTIDFSTPVRLMAGQHFSVVVEYLNAGIDKVVLVEKEASGLTINPGESFVAGADGVWVDVFYESRMANSVGNGYNTYGNVAIKALTRDVSKAAVSFGALTIDGMPEVGKSVSAKLASKSPSNATVTFAWYREGVLVGTGQSYHVQPEDVDAGLKVIATGTAAGYREIVKETGTRVRAAGIGALRIAGSRTVGSTLTLSVDGFYPSGGHTGYSWWIYRADGQRFYGNCGDALTCVVPQEALGGRIKILVSVRVIDQDRKWHTLAQRWTAVIIPNPSATLPTGSAPSLASVSVSGSVGVGWELTANPDGISPAIAPVSYQWYRGSTVIPRATSKDYVPTVADVGYQLKVRATVWNFGKSAYRESAFTAAVAPPGVRGTVKQFTGTLQSGYYIRYRHVHCDGSGTVTVLPDSTPKNPGVMVKADGSFQVGNYSGPECYQIGVYQADGRSLVSTYNGVRSYDHRIPAGTSNVVIMVPGPVELTNAGATLTVEQGKTNSLAATFIGGEYGNPAYTGAPQFTATLDGATLPAWLSLNRLTGVLTASPTTSTEAKTYIITITVSLETSDSENYRVVVTPKTALSGVGGILKFANGASAASAGYSLGYSYSPCGGPIGSTADSGRAIVDANGSFQVGNAIDKCFMLVAIYYSHDEVAAFAAAQTTYLENTADSHYVPSGSRNVVLTIPGNPPPTIAGVSVGGTAAVGSTLTATNGVVNPTGAQVTWQWYADSDKILGATSKTFTVTNSQVGKHLWVRVFATVLGNPNKGHLDSAKTAAVPTSPTPTPTPTPTVSEKVSASLSNWSATKAKDSVKVTVTSSTATWTASVSASWLSLNKTSAKSGKTLKITAAKNTGSTRTGYVTLRAGAATMVITIIQAGK
jgi:hypothetical protein